MFSAFRRGEKYKDHFEAGVYVCAKCDYELFSRYTTKLENVISSNRNSAVLQNTSTSPRGPHSIKLSTKTPSLKLRRNQELIRCTIPDYYSFYIYAGYEKFNNIS